MRQVSELTLTQSLHLLKTAAGLDTSDEVTVRALAKAMTHPHGLIDQSIH
jgi:hypothetical protein